MAAYNKFEQFGEDLVSGVHNFTAAGHVVRVYLTVVAPDAAADLVKADLAEFAGGTGYSSPGIDVGNAVSQVGTTTSVTSSPDPVWTAGAADWNAFRYVVLFNDTAAGDPLIAWWDYTQNLTLGNGETFTVDFGSSIFTLA